MTVHEERAGWEVRHHAYVYLLSTYSEYGAEEVAATLSRSTLLDLVDRNWPVTPETQGWNDEAKAQLSQWLEREDAD